MDSKAGVHLTIAVGLFVLALVGSGVSAYLTFAIATLFAVSAFVHAFLADRVPKRLMKLLNSLALKHLPHFLMLIGLGLALLGEGRWWVLGGMATIYGAYLILIYDIAASISQSSGRRSQRPLRS